MRAPKRERLLDTAESLFAREGFKGVSVNQILEESGVAKMTLYKGFKSKEALVQETLRRRADRLFLKMDGYIQMAGERPEDRLLVCFDAARDIAAARDFNGCYFVNALAEFGSEPGVEAEIARQHKVNIVRYLKVLCDACDVPDPLELAKSIHLLIEGATTAQMSHPDLANFERAKTMARLILSDAQGRKVSTT